MMPVHHFQFFMEDVKPEGWRQLLQPSKNSTGLLRRSSSWRRPGERGHYEGPAAQVNEPPRRARPQSCIEGGRMDKWLQTLERLQSRPLQKHIPQFADRTVSTPVLPNEMTGSSPLCPDLSSLWNQTPTVCPSVCESLESHARSKRVHIKPVSSAERAQFCALAPVRFGWLPIQRHVILTDIYNNHHDDSRCQQKLKSPITPVLLRSPAKLNGPRPNDREPVRPEPTDFRYWRTPEKTSSILHQASGSVSSEGGRNGLQAWNPKAGLTSKVETGQSQPHPGSPALKHPTCRRGSAPDSFSSSISSITITSRKVTHTNSGHLSPMAINDLAVERRKALVVKVTEQRTKSTSGQPVALTPGCNHEEFDHGVVLRRKATIVKMTEQREHFNREKPKTAHYRHSYTEGLKTNESQVNPSPINRPLTVSLEPGGNQWRSQNRSSLSLYLNNPNDSSAEVETNTKKHKPLRRPLSCDASLFNHTELGANAVTDPAFHNKSSSVAQKTNIDLVSSSSSEARRCSTSSCEDRSLRKEGFEWDRTHEERKEPISEIKPLTLLKVADNSPHLSADAVLALNAAAVIANIKLQAQQRQKDEGRRTTSHTATAASLTEDRGNNEHGELKEEADGKNKTHPAGPCVEFVPIESQNVPPETSLSLSEALAIRRPDFIQRSQARVRALEWRSQERQKAQSSPQRPETAGIQQQREGLLKSKDRSIMGKGLQLRSRRNYNQLPEVRKRREEEKRKTEEEKRKLASRTNRLRAELFKKKLLEQILQRGGNH
ncbi:(E2-independent) E3 ubiquitin-conjugating enzyme FATS isoform X4 [Megalobrama amblycephala]|uniref:(E2-independent) E3 ubiquitin-conjugating enzyme FATS isoform X4 n=1 Tax=Megalobrama amblycephala TaxID=75352 RepID=UPI002013C767|nr:(E2-independent) E3 ubiquitin-conjugating enzyme FATS isoform X4 [Megalobrama amblycephala]